MLVAATALRGGPTSSAPVPELPVETFFQTASMSSLAFSPDGSKILCLVPYERRQNLMVIDLVGGSKNLLSSFKDKQAERPFWASNDRVFFLVDDEGKEEYNVYAVNPDGKSPNILRPGRSVQPLRRPRDDDRNLLVQAAITNNDWWDVAKLNVRTGKLSSPIARAPGNVTSYVLDRSDAVRFAVVSDPVTRANRVLYREANRAEWRELACSGFDRPSWRPLAFDGDNTTVYVASTEGGRKTEAVFRYRTDDPEMRMEYVFGDDIYDVNELIWDDHKQKVVGITWQADRRRFHWLDPELKAIHERLEQSLPDTVHRPIQFSEDGSKIILFSYSDRDPGVYYLYDRKRQKLDEITVVQPDIDPEQMARMKPIAYQARDGLALHGYLTLPPGREPRNLPLIVNPHGGPYGPRDVWGFNPEVQFYANRGFAVLQVNFRGSGGYGDWFEAAGFKKWGLEMQDDLTDGVEWAIAQGIADPARVVISGASYGGYATMAGLVYTPELYCAGINYVGVVDINNLVPKGEPEARMYWMKTRIADLSKPEERKRVHDTSPVNFAERIRVPLLMAYGRNDPRVPIEQGYDIARALKRADIPHELIIEDDEGHGFRQEEKRIAFYQRIDAFLKQHVIKSGGDSPEVIIKPAEVLEMPVRTTGSD